MAYPSSIKQSPPSSPRNIGQYPIQLSDNNRDEVPFSPTSSGLFSANQIPPFAVSSSTTTTTTSSSHTTTTTTSSQFQLLPALSQEVRARVPFLIRTERVYSTLPVTHSITGEMQYRISSGSAVPASEFFGHMRGEDFHRPNLRQLFMSHDLEIPLDDAPITEDIKLIFDEYPLFDQEEYEKLIRGSEPSITFKNVLDRCMKSIVMQNIIFAKEDSQITPNIMRWLKSELAKFKKIDDISKWVSNQLALVNDEIRELSPGTPDSDITTLIIEKQKYRAILSAILAKIPTYGFPGSKKPQLSGSEIKGIEYETYRILNISFQENNSELVIMKMTELVEPAIKPTHQILSPSEKFIVQIKYNEITLWEKPSTQLEKLISDKLNELLGGSHSIDEILSKISTEIMHMDLIITTFKDKESVERYGLTVPEANHYSVVLTWALTIVSEVSKGSVPQSKSVTDESGVTYLVKGVIDSENKLKFKVVISGPGTKDPISVSSLREFFKMPQKLSTTSTTTYPPSSMSTQSSSAAITPRVTTPKLLSRSSTPTVVGDPSEARASIRRSSGTLLGPMLSRPIMSLRRSIQSSGVPIGGASSETLVTTSSKDTLERKSNIE